MSQIRIFTLGFRDPIEGEFGFKSLVGKLFYLEVNKPTAKFSWALENNIIWNRITYDGSSNPCVIGNQTLKVVATEAIRDGSFEIDDLELPVLGLNDFLVKDGCGDNVPEIAFQDGMAVLSGSSKLKIAVVTKKIPKKDFIEEIKQSLLIRSAVALEAFFKWICRHRYGKEDFVSMKALIESISGEKIRSAASVDSFLIKVFNDRIISGPVFLSTVIPITDEEACKIFTERCGGSIDTYRQMYRTKGSAPETLEKEEQKIRLLDSRSLVASALNETKDVSKGSFLIVGKLDPESDIGNRFVTLGPNGSITNLIKINPNDTFNVQCVFSLSGAQYEGNRKITTSPENGKIIIERLKGKRSVLIDDDDVPNKILGVPLSALDDFIEIVCNHIGAIDASIAPLHKDTTTKDWASTLATTIHITTRPGDTIMLAPTIHPVPDFTHKDITTIEKSLAFHVRNHSAKDQWDLTVLPKANGPLIDDRKEAVSKKLATIEGMLRTPLIFHLKIMLGCPKIPRSFLIQNISCYKGKPLGFNSTPKAVLPKLSGDNTYTLCPVASAIPYILMGRRLAKSWDHLYEVCTKKYNNQKVTHNITHPTEAEDIIAIYKSTIEALATENNIEVPEVKPLVALSNSTQDDDKKKVYRFTHNGEGYDMDLQFLTENFIFEIIFNSLLLSLIENDAMLNFDGNPSQLMTAESRILSTIRDGNLTSVTLRKSLYA